MNSILCDIFMLSVVKNSLNRYFFVSPQSDKPKVDAVVFIYLFNSSKHLLALKSHITELTSCHNKTSKLSNLILHQFEGLHKLWDGSKGYPSSMFLLCIEKIVVHILYHNPSIPLALCIL